MDKIVHKSVQNCTYWTHLERLYKPDVVRGQEAVGSNPATRTTRRKRHIVCDELFHFIAKLIAHLFCRSSLPNRTRSAELRIGLAASRRFCPVARKYRFYPLSPPKGRWKKSRSFPAPVVPLFIWIGGRKKGLYSKSTHDPCDIGTQTGPLDRCSVSPGGAAV